MIVYRVKWKCSCGDHLVWQGLIAMVHAQAGVTSVCVKCGQWWGITEQGAIAIDRPSQQFIDAEGKPHG